MRRAAIIAVAVALCVGGVVTRAVVDGRAALAAGDLALRRGDSEEAIARWRRAARWYLPGARHVADAYDRLVALAEAAEGHGDAAVALEAWRAVRSSALATRSFYTPYADRLDRANHRIAALMAEQPNPPDAGATAEARSAFHLALLQRTHAPRTGWTILALLGFGAWVGGGFLFALRGVGEGGTLASRPALVAAALVVAGLVAWMVGLHLA